MAKEGCIGMSVGKCLVVLMVMMIVRVVDTSPKWKKISGAGNA